MSNKINIVQVAALSGVPLLMVLGNSMLIPEFPKIKSALSINQFQVGLLITVFSASAALAIPFLGFFSDRFGRRTIIIPSLLVYGAGGAIAGASALLLDRAYMIILLSRVIQGIGAAGTQPIVIALAGDLYQTKQRNQVMGVLEAANGIGKVLSPVLGAALALIVWYALFFFYAALAIPIAAGIWLLVKEKEPPHGQPFPQYIGEIKAIFNRRGVSLVISVLAGMLVLFLLFGTLSHISDILETRFSVRGVVKGLIISVPLLLMSIIAFVTGWYLRRANKYYKAIMIGGLLVAAMAMGLLPLCGTLYVFPLVLGLLGAGSGMVLPPLNTMITSASSGGQRGGVTSLYGSVRFGGVALGPPSFTLLSMINENVMYLANAALAATIAVLVLLLVREKVLLR